MDISEVMDKYLSTDRVPEFPVGVSIRLPAWVVGVFFAYVKARGNKLTRTTVMQELLTSMAEKLRNDGVVPDYSFLPVAQRHILEDPAAADPDKIAF